MTTERGLSITSLNQNFEPEKHLIILWPSCAAVTSELERAISESLKVLSVSFGSWNDSNARLNYSRFYQKNLLGDNETVSHKGMGRFHIYVVLDSKPEYGFRETSSGNRYVNVNVFRLKEKLRELSGGGHRVHTTNSQEELRCDVAMLWGIDVLKALDFEKNVPQEINGTFGISGFEKISEVFLLLNCCTDYLVLRNYEEILELEDSEHPDIDLLVSDVVQASLVLNAEPVFPEAFRVHYMNRVGNNKVFWDLRFPGDQYMDPNWAAELRESRTEISIDELNIEIFGLAGFDYYFSLAYHALIHKMDVSQDYIYKLSNLLGKGTYSNDHIVEILINDVAQFMARSRFEVTAPLDLSVVFNKINSAKISNKIAELNSEFSLTRSMLHVIEWFRGPSR
jgi:hypothetical protein